MKINDNIRRNSKPDPDYPYLSQLNERGEIVYSVPLEAETEDAAARLHGKIRSIRIGGNEYRNVVFKPTTNRAVAYDQRAWLNSEHTRARRRASREFYVEGSLTDEDGEPVPRDENPLLRDEETGYQAVEYADMIARIAEFIDRRHPENGLYRAVYMLCVEEMEPAEIARRLGIDRPMVYYYRRVGYTDAREYRKLFG